MAESASLHAFVFGIVQGTYFRAFVSGHAHELGLTGFVRNLPDGSVEVLAEGDKKALERLVSYLHIGPPTAKVEKVLTTYSSYSGAYADFKIRY